MTIITRQEWGAKHGRGTAGLQRRGEMVIHTAAGGYPGGTSSAVDDTFANEAQLVRDIEDFHSRPRSRGGRGWNGIAYSFLVAPSGRIYEGRGWGRNGAHTQKGRNYSAYAICFLGHGDLHPATAQAWAAAEGIIRDGLTHQKLTPGYVVSGHRNYAGKSCPGNLIYPHIGRLRGLTISQPTKEWDTVATKDEIKQAVIEAFDAAVFLAEHAGKQYIVRETTQTAAHIKTGEDFDRLRRAFPHKGSVDVTAEYEVIA